MRLLSRKCSISGVQGNILFLLSMSLLTLFLNFAAPSALALQVPQPGANNFVTSAVNQVGPAVVRIDTERTIVRNIDPFMTDPFFQRFFGEEFFNTAPREELQRGQGSGFIIDSNGIILTNAHVVSGADRVQVTLKDGRSFEGNVLGTDRVTDLAVVEIDDPQGQLPMAPLGDSDRVQVGDWAIAVGNPLGLDNTVTLGIISTLNRPSSEVGIPDKRVDFIQTDAAINPGNSGGPLLNDQGEVIGINTAIRANATGIGFAIPINKAKTIQGQLTKGEKVAHPYIGVQIVNLTPELAKENNRDPNAPLFLPEIEGVLVMKVIPDTPAADAGLRRGDVIIAIDNQPIKTVDKLQRIVDQSGLGTSLSIQVKRGNQTRQFRVKTAQLEEVMDN
ncbi:MAG: trypsin-like peptidase domain-containing protein [Roseofilum sp. SID2]|nr:trypsin-like peptidase domain-containing protein [Roseofilum sp. Belize Diploria]MBP0014444.1 trypsin-like peptidase domain-containing protein [Roseofilum sp. SID3]MBP0023653.1 trypsin-like peptidase domain-containing protein [Roseofilum sp. SID2]MBP0033914.1 trypsin-like peptidase domain-containing protein [Roseofilum sp. Belize BBD 4]HBQ98479.1 serine protease [Cyanobacteria bacterium UBA11691]